MMKADFFYTTAAGRGIFKFLQKAGVFDALEAKGCKDGDTVSIYDFEFDYVK